MTETLPRNTTIRKATKPDLLCVECEREVSVGEEYLSERFKPTVKGVKQHRRRMHRAHIPSDHPVLALIAEHGWDETKRLLNEQNGH